MLPCNVGAFRPDPELPDVLIRTVPSMQLMPALKSQPPVATDRDPKADRAANWYEGYQVAAKAGVHECAAAKPEEGFAVISTCSSKQ